MATNYVLIDFENVQPCQLAGFDADHFRILVFVGITQKKIPVDIAAALQKFGSRAEYIRISGSGANALDFHIAFYIGQLSAQDPTAAFGIISKDTGFDPLVKHLRERRLKVSRSNNVPCSSLSKAANSKSRTEKLDAIVADLRRRGDARPRTIQKLTNSIKSRFQKQLSDQDVAQILESMQDKGWIVVSELNVSYHLPEAPTQP